jgi:hypothetical protein
MPYFTNKAGRRVPAVTTVLGVLDKGFGLMHYYWTLGRDGKPLDYKDDAPKVGDLTHRMIESWLKEEVYGLKGYEPEIIESAKTAFGQFLAWWKDSNLEWVCSEEDIVSESLQMGGRLDCIAQVIHNRALMLLDFTVSPKVYEDKKLQIAAYRMLWNERALARRGAPGATDDPRLMECSRAAIVRLPRAPGDGFEVVTMGDLGPQEYIVEAARGIYAAKKGQVPTWLNRA